MLLLLHLLVVMLALVATPVSASELLAPSSSAADIIDSDDTDGELTSYFSPLRPVLHKPPPLPRVQLPNPEIPEPIELEAPVVRMPRRLPGNGTVVRPDPRTPPAAAPFLRGPKPRCGFPPSPEELYADEPPDVSEIDPGLRNFYVGPPGINSAGTIELCTDENPDLVVNPPVAAAALTRPMLSVLLIAAVSVTLPLLVS